MAIGHRDPSQGWISEGWWNIASQECKVILEGDLIARYYYIYAIDYDRGGDWSGKAQLCTDDKEFTITGIDDCSKRGCKATGDTNVVLVRPDISECAKRGYKHRGFMEIDTKEDKDYTVTLKDTVESSDQAANTRASGN